jgi:hypothetical protein
MDIIGVAGVEVRADWVLALLFLMFIEKLALTGSTR